jgi:hypothetical protein
LLKELAGNLLLHPSRDRREEGPAREAGSVRKERMLFTALTALLNSETAVIDDGEIRSSPTKVQHRSLLQELVGYYYFILAVKGRRSSGKAPAASAGRGLVYLPRLPLY